MDESGVSTMGHPCHNRYHGLMFQRLLLIFVGIYLAGATGWVLWSARVREKGTTVNLLNAACDPTRELWREINTRFVEHMERERGESIAIRQSHGGSSSQARAIVDGLDADVATLALWSDTNAIHKAGLIEDGWENHLPNRSLPFVSTIVFVVRKGNPKGIKDWADLARPGVQVITPNPKTSGNGKWSLLAAYGSVVLQGGSDAEGQEYLYKLFAGVPVLDTSARAATMTFSQKKIGDVHLTWENEAYLEVEEAKGALEIVRPPISVVAEPHVAVVTANAKRKGTFAAAEAYMRFAYTREAQDIIARHHYRPTDPEAWEKHKETFGAVEMFDVARLAPGKKGPAEVWAELNRRFFSDGALFDSIYTRLHGGGKAP